MPYTPIVATLGYVLSPDGTKALLVHRNKRDTDQHLGKYNGLGGKLDPLEDVVAGLRREVREEAGIEIDGIELRGTVSWPGFGKDGEDWLGFVFLVTGWTGEPHRRNVEGELSWVPLERILQWCDPAQRAAAGIDMWAGDGYFLPLVFSADPRAFHAVMPYEGGKPVGWGVELI